ncbi:MAG: hypothetical protein ACI85N_000106 [Gammaproteobacteria bacterium]|jgi:hypothetical protein
MAICPVANSVGCEKCGIVKVCVLRSVLGNYGAEQPGQNSEQANSTESESKPPD